MPTAAAASAPIAPLPTKSMAPALSTSQKQPLSALTTQDPYLTPHLPALQYRNDCYAKLQKQIGDLAKFSLGYKEFGFQILPQDKSIHYKEWAPNAKEAALVGEFSTVRFSFSSSSSFSLFYSLARLRSSPGNPRDWIGIYLPLSLLLSS